MFAMENLNPDSPRKFPTTLTMLNLGARRLSIDEEFNRRTRKGGGVIRIREGYGSHVNTILL
jgi:hypothetical protein